MRTTVFLQCTSCRYDVARVVRLTLRFRVSRLYVLGVSAFRLIPAHISICMYCHVLNVFEIVACTHSNTEWDLPTNAYESH